MVSGVAWYWVAVVVVSGLKIFYFFCVCARVGIVRFGVELFKKFLKRGGEKNKTKTTKA